MMICEPADLSKALIESAGLKKSYASLLANGKKRPSLSLAVEIEEKIGVPPRFWVRRNETKRKRKPRNAAEAT